MQDRLRSIKNNVEGKYRPRLSDTAISEMLSSFGGVLITGPKWCGKSWSGIRHANSVVFADDDATKERAALDPRSVLDGDYPMLVDEWQESPKLWDAARREIDFNTKKGLFIFTGSVTPPTDSASHSGTGRFAVVQMRPLSLFESGDSKGTVSLSRLFSEGRTDPVPSESGYLETVRLICRGGWPAGVWGGAGDATRIPQQYLNTVARSDISRPDGKSRDPSIVRKVMRSVARNSATMVKSSVISADVSCDGGRVSDQTVRAYLESLKQIFMIEEQKAWTPSLRSKTRIRASPKIHFTDPSLAAAALNASPDVLSRDPKTAGLLFESLCHRDVCAYSDSMTGEVCHYRDDSGLEADSIIQLADGRWGAVEVKLGPHEYDKAASSLSRLKEKVCDEAGEPSFLMILSGSGGMAYTRPDGVTVVPIDCLGP